MHVLARIAVIRRRAMQYYSGPPYGVSDMQQLVLAAASHHMLRSDGPPHHYYHHEQPQFHHQHQQYIQSSLQPHDFLDFYHRQESGLHQEDMQGSHILLGLHHHQHQELPPKAASILDPAALQLPLSHHISLGLECAPGGILTSSNINHDLATHYKPVAVQDFAFDTNSPSLKCSRWTREETAALLRVRSETDALFRDSSTINDALWDEVSRRLLAEGIQRSAKNCKETFENIQKYAKIAMGNPERQLEKECRLLEGSVTVYTAAGPGGSGNPGDMAAIAAADGPGIFDTNMAASDINKLDDRMVVHDAQETSTEPNSPASTSFGGDVGVEQQSRGRKRKRGPSWRSMRAFFQDLASQLMERQDALHKKFLAAIERREAERLRREEAYKRQEMARLSREQELRAREHMLAASRDAALVAFLQKVTGETLHLPEISTADGVAVAGRGAGELDGTPSGEDVSADGMKDGGVDVNSRRWPKVEVLALIRVRTTLEPRFQEAGPKAQLWEEVSSSLASLGFSRSSKRCKEKWENINKYFRKTKDNVGRKLRADSASKTCPYFHQLELLYERGILASPSGNKPVSTYKLEGSQTSTDLLECSSNRENQRNQEANGAGNHHSYGQLQPGTSISDMPMPSNLQATTDGANVMDLRRLPIMSAITAISPTSKTTCSSTGNGGFSDGVHLQDVDVLQKTICSSSALGCMLGPVNQINVNCHPPQHFAATDGSHDGSLSPENCNNGAVMLGVGLGPHFLKEMLEAQQQAIYENHQLEDDHIKHDSNRTEMENAIEEKDVKQRMEYPEEPEEERSGITNQAAAQHDSSILMALVHKLAPGSGGHTAEFDLSSPHSSCGHV